MITLIFKCYFVFIYAILFFSVIFIIFATTE